MQPKMGIVCFENHFVCENLDTHKPDSWRTHFPPANMDAFKQTLLQNKDNALSSLTPRDRDEVVHQILTPQEQFKQEEICQDGNRFEYSPTMASGCAFDPNVGRIVCQKQCTHQD